MSKRKGNRYERELVNLLQDHGLVAYRQPLSGALARGEWKGDIKVELETDKELLLEVKYRRNGSGFKKLYDIVNRADGYWHLQSAGLAVLHQDWWLSDDPPDRRRMQRSWKSQFKTLHGWLDGADWLAVRMPRSPWLFITGTE